MRIFSINLRLVYVTHLCNVAPLVVGGVKKKNHTENFYFIYEGGFFSKCHCKNLYITTPSPLGLPASRTTTSNTTDTAKRSGAESIAIG